MRPNILMLFPDQHRPDWLPGSPGLPLRMPNLESLMARGMVFTEAVTPSPLCAPARACLASGRDYPDCGVPDNSVDYPLDQPTVYQRLRDTGYRVAGVGKFDLHKATQDWGLDGSRMLAEWGFTDGVDNEGKFDAVASGAETPAGPYMRFLHENGLADVHVNDFSDRHGKGPSYRQTRPTPLPQDAYCDNWLTDNALGILADLPAGQPWYLAVNFTGPHNPVDVTPAMQEEWAGVEFPLPVGDGEVSPETHQQIRRNYAAMLANIDAQIGRLLELIDARGELDNTLVVYSSDHGEMLGDLGRWAKSTYFQPSMGVPMIVAGPGVVAGTSSALVSLQDLTATFLDAAGADQLPEMDGRSLWPCLRGDAERHRPHVRCGLDDWRAVYNGRHKLAVDPSGTHLYDLATDPHELVDLAGAAPDDVARLTPLLELDSWSDLATTHRRTP